MDKTISKVFPDRRELEQEPILAINLNSNKPWCCFSNNTYCIAVDKNTGFIFVIDIQVVYLLCIFTGDGHHLTTIVLKEAYRGVAFHNDCLYFVSKDKVVLHEDVPYYHISTRMVYHMNVEFERISVCEKGNVYLLQDSRRIYEFNELINYNRCIHTFLETICAIRVMSNRISVLCLIPTTFHVLSLEGNILYSVSYDNIIQVRE